MIDDEYVECLLCGKHYRQITNSHLVKAHGITLPEYRERFPDAVIVTARVRSVISSSACELNRKGVIGFHEGHKVNEGKTPWNKGSRGKQVGWNKGLTKETSESIANAAKKVSETRKKMIREGSIKRPAGQDNPMFGNAAWNRGRTKNDLESLMTVSRKVSATRKKMFEEGRLKRLIGPDNPMFGKKLTEEHKAALWGGWKSSGTRPEMKFLEMISEYEKWKYVGDGKFFIRTKIKTRVPDFVNIEEKKIVEIYGDYWHRNDNPQDQIAEYKEVGWDCIVLWEHEVMDDDFTVELIKDFSGGKKICEST